MKARTTSDLSILLVGVSIMGFLHKLPNFQQTLDQLGIPEATQKKEDPSALLAFLGVLLMMHKFKLCLLVDTVARLQEIAQLWCHESLYTREELESL